MTSMASMLCIPGRAEWNSYKKSVSRRGETDSDVPSAPRKRWSTIRSNSASEAHSVKSRGSFVLRRRRILHLGSQSVAQSVGQEQNHLRKSIMMTEIRQAEKREERRQRRKKQTEDTRKLLNNLATRLQDPDLQSFALVLSSIIDHWQYHAKDNDPTEHAIKFHEGALTATLLQVFALIPEEYQDHILVDDSRRSEGGNRSWLDEPVMNILVQEQMSHSNPQPQPVVFGSSLTCCVRERLDAVCQQESNKSWLEHFVGMMKSGAPQNEWNSEKAYTFHSSTERIVYFWNYRECHWTLLVTDIKPQVWTHTLYNSYSMLKTVRAWTDATTHLPHLEKLIRGASGFPQPKQVKYELGKSAQQDNDNECGVITVYNAVELLNGRIPQMTVDTKSLRLYYLKLILVSLQDRLVIGLIPQDNDSETPSPKSPSTGSHCSDSHGSASSDSGYYHSGSISPCSLGFISPSSGSPNSECCGVESPNFKSLGRSHQDNGCYYERPVPQFPSCKPLPVTSGSDSTERSSSSAEDWEDEQLFALTQHYKRLTVPHSFGHGPSRWIMSSGSDSERETATSVGAWEGEGLFAFDRHFQQLGADVTDRLFNSIEECDKARIGVTETQAFRHFCDALFLMMNLRGDL